MSELQRGTLKVTKKGQRAMVQVLIDGKPFNLAQGQLSSNLTPSDGLEVEFLRVGGQPQQVRAVGQPFVAPHAVQASQKGRSKRGSKPGEGRPLQSASGGRSRQGQTENAAQEAHRQEQREPDFHNPYNFVPAPPRKIEHPELGDAPPVPQDSFDPQRFTGRIRVRMVVKTPVLVPDTDPANVREDANGHKIVALRVDTNGLPAIPSSTVRGMLRSAYEAITNSRFGRFSRSHQNPLAFRMDARESLRLIPARIANGNIRLLAGTSQIGNDGRPNGSMYAAWLPRYWNGQVDRNAIRYADGSLPQHGDEVACWVELFQHHRWEWMNRRGDRSQWRGRHVADFHFWKVRCIRRQNESLSDAPSATSDAEPQDGRSWCQPVHNSLKSVSGWVCVTNANINRKHDERVFFMDSESRPLSFTLTDAHRSMWRELIYNYQATHEEDLRRRRSRRQRPDEYLGPEPGQTAWSRHVYTAEDRELDDGTLCYVRLSADKTDVEALFPVMIARELYSASPWELLHPSLRPAASIDELSPADRVFGWVRTDADKDQSKRDNERVAVRGLLHAGPVTCESSIADAVECFPPPGVPLAILSTPKPQQGRFYVAKSPNGEAQDDGLSKVDAGYSNGKGLRGRKVYPYEKCLKAEHWYNPTDDRTQTSDANGYYQEYRRPRDLSGREQRDDQNRSILGWVKPGAVFTVDVHVQDLSQVELGALLWLLKLPDEHYFRLGGGKPLGFGSVRLTVDECDLRTGHELRSRYAAWNPDLPSSDPSEEAIRSFKQAVLDAYPPNQGKNGFDDIPFIKAFLVACKGFDDELPAHYPRATEDGQPGPPSPDGESFKWFVANEKNGARYALRDLAKDDGLPTLQDSQQRRDGRGLRRR